MDYVTKMLEKDNVLFLMMFIKNKWIYEPVHFVVLFSVNIVLYFK